MRSPLGFQSICMLESDSMNYTILATTHVHGSLFLLKKKKKKKTTHVQGEAKIGGFI